MQNENAVSSSKGSASTQANQTRLKVKTGIKAGKDPSHPCPTC